MKPSQQRVAARNGRQIRRDEVARRTFSSRSMMEYDKWVEGIKSSDNNRSPGAWSSRIRPNSKSMQFDRDEEFVDSETNGAVSPTLWKKSPSRENSYTKRDAQNAYPATRNQEIAAYRKEMMEMARGLPEGELELTLRDIVEERKEFKEADEEKETKTMKNQEKNGSVVSNNSTNTGLLVRMLSPLSIAVKKTSSTLLNRGEKVTVKEVEGKKKKKNVIAKKKNKDEEWWKKNEFSDKESTKTSSVGSSSSSNSNSSGSDHFNRNTSMKQTSCYCFRPVKNKAKSS